MINKGSLVKKIVSTIPFIIIGFCLLWTIYANHYENMLESLSSSIYSQNAYRFKLQGNGTDIDWSNILYADSIIYCDLNEGDGLKGIYAGADATFPIPIMEGEFFSQDDFRQDNNVAVVGKGMTDKLMHKDNKRYISVSDQEYEVIGIMGLTSVPSTIDYSVLLTLENAKRILGNDVKYTFDGRSSSVKKSISELQSSHFEFDTLARKTVGLSKLYSTKYNSIFLYNCFSIIALLMLILFVYFEIYNKKSEIKIYSINGATKVQIAFYMMKKYLLSKYFGLSFGMFLAFFILIFIMKTTFKFLPIMYAVLISFIVINITIYITTSILLREKQRDGIYTRKRPATMKCLYTLLLASASLILVFTNIIFFSYKTQISGHSSYSNKASRLYYSITSTIPDKEFTSLIDDLDFIVNAAALCPAVDVVNCPYIDGIGVHM